MANGQPRPAFYVAVFAVVIGLVGLAIWRYGGGSGAGTSIFSSDELNQVAGKAENPDSSGITTVKEYNFVPSAKLPEVKGISSYTPMNNRTVRFAINVWAGWGPNHLREQWVQAWQGVEDAVREGLQCRARADRRPGRDA
jgi:hypothetical protein